MQALVCNSLAPTDLLLFFLLFRMVRVRVISHSKCALDSVHLEKKLLSHIKEKTVGLKRGRKKWVKDTGSRSLLQATDQVKC